MATAVTPKVFKNYIDGEWIPARSGKAIEDRNPANSGELVGMFPASSADDVNQAIDAAKQAFKTWRLTPAPKRAEILYRAAEILTQRKEDFAIDMTREMGKVLTETRGDVQEAIDMTYLMAKRTGSGRTTPCPAAKLSSEISDRLPVHMPRPQPIEQSSYCEPHRRSPPQEVGRIQPANVRRP